MFDREYKSKLADLKIKLLLDKHYVDDKNKAAREVPADIDVEVGESGDLKLVVELELELE